MAALHARCFTRPRPWTKAEFRDMLAGPGVFSLIRPQGLLLGRTILDEAELLTLAVSPECRRQGQGLALITAFTQRARALGATEAFLEVASDNAPARALYRRQGWVEAGCRRNYYAPGVDGLILRLGL